MTLKTQWRPVYLGGYGNTGWSGWTHVVLYSDGSEELCSSDRCDLGLSGGTSLYWLI